MSELHEDRQLNPRQRRWQAWLAGKAQEAGLSPQEHRVAELAVVERKGVPAIARALRMQQQQAASLQRKALDALSGLPEFWTVARQFERELLACAANKDDYDERPADLRGVASDRASDRFQGARIVGAGDLRIRQSALAAARLAMCVEA